MEAVLGEDFAGGLQEPLTLRGCGGLRHTKRLFEIVYTTVSDAVQPAC
jgi:hypothetical protein